MTSNQHKNLVDIYTRAVSNYASNPLFGIRQPGEAANWKWMSYGEFGECTDEIRSGLSALGVQSGDPVAMISNNRPEWAAAAYASYGLGASFVPMYESQHATDWEYILRDCGARVVFVANDKIRKAVERFQGNVDTLDHVVDVSNSADATLSFNALREKGRPTPKDPIAPAPESVAGFIYTSGTTGKPKGVLLTHANLAKNVNALRDVFPIKSEDRSLSFLPWAHSFGQTVELHSLFASGASMGIVDDVQKIVQYLPEVKPTLLFSVPRIFNRIHDGVIKRINQDGGLKKSLFELALKTAEQKRSLAEQRKSSGFIDLKHRVLDQLVFAKVRERFGGRLKYAFSGGAAISREVAEFIDSLGVLVYEGYGLTETSPVATANWPGARKIGSVGKPIPGIRIEIDRSVTDDPKHGEIIVHGHNVMKGYHGLPEENEKVFTDEGGFRTGDMGYVDDDGYLYITGRIKEQYKLENGKYVVPAPLEELLKLSPFVTSAFVFGSNRPHNVALVVPDMEALRSWADEQGISGDDDLLLRHDRVKGLVAEQLEKYSGEFKQFEKIRAFELLTEDFTVENGMLTPKMSVKRRKVLEAYQDRLDRLYR